MNRYKLCLLLILSIINIGNAQLIDGSYRFSPLNTQNNPKFLQTKAPINHTWSTQYEPSGTYAYQQHDESYSADQVWNIERVEKDYFKITSAYSGKCMDASTGDGQIFPRDYTGIDTQKWSFTASAMGGYVITNKQTGKVLSVQGGNGAQDSGFLIMHETMFPQSLGADPMSSQRFLVTPFTLTNFPVQGIGTGLRATYNNGTKFTGLVALTRTDATLNFETFNTSVLPSSAFYNRIFSVRWEGKIEFPVSAKYRLYLKAAYAVKVWVNGKLVVERNHYDPNDLEFFVNAQQGEQKDIKIENETYQDQVGTILQWLYPGQSKSVIPKKYLYPTLGPKDVAINTSSPNNLQVIAIDSVNRVKLRWIPTTPESWFKGNNAGYKIERFTTKRNGSALGTPYPKTEWVVKPEPMNSAYWKKYIPNYVDPKYFSTFRGTSTFIMAAYQLLYGQNEIALPQRYFSMAVNTNLSFEAAKASGLGFVDKTALDTEEYTYTISFLDPTTGIDAGSIAVKAGTGLPTKPDTPKIQYMGKLVSQKENANIMDRDSLPVRLSINVVNARKYFGSFWVEKSSSATNNQYVKINKQPVFNFSHIDSLIAFDTISYHKNSTCKYRIIGRSYFDEDWTSNEVTSTYTAPLEFGANIIKSRVISDTTAYIKWVYPSGQNFSQADIQALKARISSFSIEKSDFPNSGFTTLMSNIATTKDSTFLMDPITPTKKFAIKNNAIYVRVVANGTDGKKVYSSSVMIQPIDNLPPQKPKILSATLSGDKKTVSVTWQSNTESDLDGYVVYRKNFTGDKYWNVLTPKSIKRTNLVDTLHVSVNTDKLWYGLAALDTRGNYSLVDSISVTRPDLLAPINPMFKQVTTKKDTVLLSWRIANYGDVKDYTLYRNEQAGCPANGWITLKTYTSPQKDSTYTDKGINGKTYCYGLTARDNVNNSSTATPLIVALNFTPDRLDIQSFTGSFVFDEKKIDLSWLYNDTSSDLSSFELTRAEGTNTFSSWKVVTGQQKSITDSEVKFEKQYKYAVRAYYTDGTSSKWKTFDITLPKGCKAGVLRAVRNTTLSSLGISQDIVCSEVILEPGFDTEGQAYEAAIDTTPYN
ncbi:PA14 domain-containing protein [Cellulophaga sp. BC115SP]|uniref:RICIN domain-containing protein n=1 Tax=Cellulophaga sp. BC115SP TaxID=2683263 RepID=UPI00141252A0|nr:PA14 domain-containing protein [Cellulophaga sp. BC115SP]NBB31429.1 hypothetical protein [Cellulophaga sp. BC115SP]